MWWCFQTLFAEIRNFHYFGFYRGLKFDFVKFWSIFGHFLRVFSKHKSVKFSALRALGSLKMYIVTLCCGLSKRYLQKSEIFIISDFTVVQSSNLVIFGPKMAKFGLWTPVKSEIMKISNFCK